MSINVSNFDGTIRNLTVNGTLTAGGVSVSGRQFLLASACSTNQAINATPANINASTGLSGCGRLSIMV